VTKGKSEPCLDKRSTYAKTAFKH